MNTRYVIPVTLALAAHGALLFGVPRSPRALVFKENEPARPFPLPPVPPAELELVLADPRDREAAKGDVAPRPPSPEPIAATPDVDKFAMPKPPIETGPIGDSTRIVPLGDPEGDVRGRIARTGIIDGIQLDNAPRTRSQVSPVFPPEKRRLGERGEVWVEFEVDERGAVHNPRVTKSSDRAFEEPTLRAVAKWRFEPGKRDGQIVAFRMSVPVIFSLND